MKWDKQYNKKSISPSSLIVDGKIITLQQDTVEHSNNFFTSVGLEIQDDIPPTKSNIKNYLFYHQQLQKKSVTLFKRRN